MAGIFVSRAPAGMPRCARCKRPFTPKHDGDRYGPKCARKMAGKPDPECPVDPDICPGDCGHGVGEPDAQKERVCRECGCTDFTPCPGGCAWVADDLCSACATDEELFAGIQTAKDRNETRHTVIV